MKDDDDDDDENTLIHWFCLIPPPGESQRPHFQPWMKNLFEPLWRNPLLFHDDQKTLYVNVELWFDAALEM